MYHRMSLWLERARPGHSMVQRTGGRRREGECENAHVQNVKVRGPANEKDDSAIRVRTHVGGWWKSAYSIVCSRTVWHVCNQPGHSFWEAPALTQAFVCIPQDACSAMAEGQGPLGLPSTCSRILSIVHSSVWSPLSRENKATVVSSFHPTDPRACMEWASLASTRWLFYVSPAITGGCILRQV